MPTFNVARYIVGRCSLRKLFICIGCCCLAVCCLAFSVGLMGQIFRYDGNNRWGKSTRNIPLAKSSDGKEQENARLPKLSPLENAVESAVTAEREVKGKLNLHSWNICGLRVDDLRNSPLFPRFPVKKEFATNFTSERKASEIGERVFGFVYPKFTGKYQFAITSDDTSELWLSANEDPRKVRLVASVDTTDGVAWTEPGDYKKYPSQISGEVFLETGQRYFIEALHKQGGGLSHVYVLWKPPRAKQFEVITGQFLSPFHNDSDPFLGTFTVKSLDIPSHYKQTPPPAVTEESLQFYYKTKAFRQEDLANILPTFPYSPSYNLNGRKIKQFAGIWILRRQHSYIYPGTSFWKPVDKLEVLPKATVEQVVNQFMSALENNYAK